MEHLSLVAGWTVAGIVVAFAGLLGLVVARARSGTLLLPLRVAMWASVATAATALLVHGTGLVPTDIPRWFYALALLPFVGPAVAAVGWRTLGVPGRIAALVCLPVGLLAATAIANQHYEYWPTVASAFGRDHVDPLLTPAVAAPPDAVAAAAGAGLGGGGERGPIPSGPVSHGWLTDVKIPGTHSGFSARTARVWLPPDYFAHPDVDRSAVIVIGGTPSWPSDWTRAAGLDRTADVVAAAHPGQAPILVMVDPNGTPFGDTECVDGPRGNAESYLVDDVRDYVIQHFGAAPAASAWGLLGYSEGGTCALTVALRHPDQFAAFVDLAGDLRPSVGSRNRTIRTLYGGNDAEWAAHDPLTLLGQRSFALAGWFEVGRGDRGHAHAQLEEAARQAGMAVESHTTGGGHDFGFVSRALTDALPWLTGVLGTGR